MKNFESFLAPQLNEFIAYRQNLGFSLRPIRLFLLLFDRYVKEKKIKPGVLQPSFFLELRANLKMESVSINKLLGSVSVFFKFMVRTDYYTENPLEDIPPLPEHSFIPFIFSPEQIDRLLEAACKRIRRKPLSVFSKI